MKLSKIESKKGLQLSQAFGAVLTLVLVSVLVIISIVIFVQLGVSFKGASTVTVTNESGAYINETGYTLANAGACQFNSASITGAWNFTSGEAILAANYTLSAGGVLTNATDANYADVNMSYTYKWGSGACDASDAMSTEFGNYTSLIGLVGTIIFLALVIGVLVASFAIGGRKET